MADSRPEVASRAGLPRQRATTAPAFTLVTAGVVAVLATYSFSRLTGWLSGSIDMPVGTATLVVAVALCLWASRRFGGHGIGRQGFGLGLGRSREHAVLIGVSILAVAAVVGAFRMTGSAAPYDATVGEFVIVPVGEELLFRGFLLGVLLELFRRRQVGAHSAAWAVLISAVAFGIGHLGNLGHVETAFVVLQVFVAFVFGVVAGHVRMRTESVVGAVLMHATMNIVAVV